MTDEKTPFSMIQEPNESEENEDVIELTDVAGAAAENVESSLDLSEVLSDPRQVKQFDMDFQDVDAFDSGEDSPAANDADQAKELQTFSLEYELDAIAAEEEADDFAQSLGLHLEDAGAAALNAASFEGTVSAAPAVSTEQIEAALERVIERMLAEKIEKIIHEVLEKAVSREMQRLKAIFMENSSNAP